MSIIPHFINKLRELTDKGAEQVILDLEIEMYEIDSPSPPDGVYTYQWLLRNIASRLTSIDEILLKILRVDYDSQYESYDFQYFANLQMYKASFCNMSRLAFHKRFNEYQLEDSSRKLTKKEVLESFIDLHIINDHLDTDMCETHCPHGIISRTVNESVRRNIKFSIKFFDDDIGLQRMYMVD